MTVSASHFTPSNPGIDATMVSGHHMDRLKIPMPGQSLQVTATNIGGAAVAYIEIPWNSAENVPNTP